MKKLFFLPVYYCAVSLLIPSLILSLFSKEERLDLIDATESTFLDTLTVFNHTTQTTQNMSTEDYITGVVAAEMPASFETEALKAQAVAARTYAKYKSSLSEHEADVCTDYAHCQAYLSNEDMHRVWGEDFDSYYNKIRTAVIETAGETLTYEDEPVMAVFHSMGGGHTENSADVWGQAVPYLVGVESPGEEVGTNYRSTITISFDEFKSKLKSEYPTIRLNSPEDVSTPVLTDGGHVKSIIIGSVSIPGTKMRSIFSLRSTLFSLSFEQNTVTFSVTGYGHGVGMSQYGANAMAKSGKTYREILSHYYQGTTLE